MNRDGFLSYFVFRFFSSAPPKYTPSVPLHDRLLTSVSGKLRSRVCVYRGSKRVAEAAVPAEGEARVELNGKTWRLAREESPIGADGVRLELAARFTGTKSPPTAFGFEIELENWGTDAYIVMPAAVYAGNRFVAKPLEYPCILVDPEDFRPDVSNTISEVPRLEIGDGPSRIQLLAGDMSTPAIGIYFPRSQSALWLLSTQRTELGETGFEIEESDDRKRAWIRLMTPGVREGDRYGGGQRWSPSEDRGARLSDAEEHRLAVWLHVFSATGVDDLFARFVDLRKEPNSDPGGRQEIPFSAAWDLLERKYNTVNWEERWGYYACGDRQSRYAHWQIGWVGGIISSHALLADGTDESRERAMRNLDYVAADGQAPSGLYWSVGIEGELFSDMVDMSWGEDWHLVRRSGDALYYILRQIELAGDAPRPEWLESTRMCAEAFVRMWDKFGQFGQFVSEIDGDIRVGGTTSGGIVPAGMALASLRFSNPEYLRVAQESARYYAHEFLERGFTSGGPGEAAQCPDSESAFGLLESLVTLHDLTGDPEWLGLARGSADQCASWVMSYDFRFPPASTFGRLDMRTTGSVWANAQNKHSAPGICTHSGVSLFRLFRATGDRRYLELFRDLAHGVPQYLSRADRPVFGMLPGWMCERVNTSDWEAPYMPPGEGFHGGCWCEVSCMLTWAEAPGLYVQPDTGLVTAIDHVDVVSSLREGGKLIVELRNPTKFEARLKVFVESSSEISKPLPLDFMAGSSTTTIRPGETVRLEF